MKSEGDVFSSCGKHYIELHAGRCVGDHVSRQENDHEVTGQQHAVRLLMDAWKVGSVLMGEGARSHSKTLTWRPVPRGPEGTQLFRGHLGRALVARVVGQVRSLSIGSCF